MMNALPAPQGQGTPGGKGYVHVFIRALTVSLGLLGFGCCEPARSSGVFGLTGNSQVVEAAAPGDLLWVLGSSCPEHSSLSLPLCFFLAGPCWFLFGGWFHTKALEVK